MATLRVPPSLWSALCRSGSEVYNPTLRSARAAQRFRAYHASTRRYQQQQVPQRYGVANEPPPHIGGGKGTGVPAKEAVNEEAKALPKIGEKLQHVGEEEVQAEQKAEVEEKGASEAKKEPTTVEGKVSSPMTDPMLDAGEATPTEAKPGAPRIPEEKPLESVLDTVTDNRSSNQQSSKQDESHAEEHPDKTFDEHSPPIKAPHMEPPRYVHHYDTYSFVKRLEEEGSWEQKQAITVMKAVRQMLADNTDLAKEALVSKSFLENEAYLFKAACAELRTEVQNRRRSEQEKMRTERTQLQHEVDILSQRLGQESAALKDELKGMFDDRKMTVRNEQRDVESKLQQLNYKITVNLQADAKSDVEGLRWVMTRRVILTLGIVVLMILGTIKLASTVAHQQEEAAKRRKNVQMSSAGTQTAGEYVDEGRGGGVAGRGAGVLLKEGDNPAYVSLG